MEWSFLVRAEDISAQGKIVQLEPNQTEKKALAKRLGIVALDDLKVKVKLSRENAHIVHVEGHLDARVTQKCVVSLEPIETDISEDFEAWFADESRAVNFKKAQHEAQNKKELMELPMLEEADDPEPMENGMIELGDLSAQYLSLSIPAYPQKEGVAYQNPEPEEAPKADKTHLKVNPFAALKDWRPKD